MASVRISGNWKHPDTQEWFGAPEIDAQNRIARSIDIPEAAYQQIEQAIREGHVEGIVAIEGGVDFHWFLDR